MNDNQDLSEFNRRDFLRGGSFAAIATLMGGVRLMAETNATETAAINAPVNRVKVAVIGLGTWGRELLDQLARIPQADVAGICDNYPASLKRAASKAPNAKPTEDYKALLADKEIRAIIVATPTHLHKEITLAALAAGKHVYCEAPLASTIEDAKEIALAAKKASKVVFQPGLQMRSDPQEAFLLKFVRSGALGGLFMGRVQWNKKTSWRATSPNPDREKALNWRLAKETSLGLVGEVGLHQVDRACRYFNGMPTAVSGFGSVSFWKDGREVADTVQSVFEFADGVRLAFDATLANSFEGESNAFYGNDAAVMIRSGSAWMFKEADAPLLGWEVYARKDTILKETGISLRMDASKLKSQGDQAAQQVEAVDPPIFFALQNFLRNSREVESAVEDFTSTYGDDPAALAEHMAKNVKRLAAADYLDGYRATVLAIKAGEAVAKGEKVTINKDLYELA
jgi:predicted dehydrogenase